MRGERVQGEDDQPYGLFIEFDDELDAEADAEDAAEDIAGTFETETTVEAGPFDSEAPLEVVASRPPSRWSGIPARYRVAAALVVLALAAGSVTAARLIREARQRARERFTLAVVTDRYQPAIAEVGLNMGITLVNHGPAPVTVVFMQVTQPGLRLAFYPVQVPLPVGTPTAFTLVGVFDCQNQTKASDASTVDVTVNSQSGMSSVTLELESGTVPPKGWERQRSAFCASPASH